MTSSEAFEDEEDPHIRSTPIPISEKTSGTCLRPSTDSHTHAQSYTCLAPLNRSSIYSCIGTATLSRDWGRSAVVACPLCIFWIAEGPGFEHPRLQLFLSLFFLFFCWTHEPIGSVFAGRLDLPGCFWAYSNGCKRSRS